MSSSCKCGFCCQCTSPPSGFGDNITHPVVGLSVRISSWELLLGKDCLGGTPVRWCVDVAVVRRGCGLALVWSGVCCFLNHLAEAHLVGILSRALLFPGEIVKCSVIA